MIVHILTDGTIVILRDVGDLRAAIDAARKEAKP